MQKPCPYCNHECEVQAELCSECGYRFVQREIVSETEWTDEKIASFAGFAMATHDKATTGSGSIVPPGMQKLVKNLFFWVILPGILTFVAQKLHLMPDMGLDKIMHSQNMPGSAEANKNITGDKDIDIAIREDNSKTP